jgi:hypothetical protein
VYIDTHTHTQLVCAGDEPYSSTVPPHDCINTNIGLYILPSSFLSTVPPHDVPPPPSQTQALGCMMACAVSVYLRNSSCPRLPSSARREACGHTMQKPPVGVQLLYLWKGGRKDVYKLEKTTVVILSGLSVKNLSKCYTRDTASTVARATTKIST